MPRGGARPNSGPKGGPSSTRSIRLPDPLWWALDEAARNDEDGRTVNALVRQAVGQFLGMTEQEEVSMDPLTNERLSELNEVAISDGDQLMADLTARALGGDLAAREKVRAIVDPVVTHTRPLR